MRFWWLIGAAWCLAVRGAAQGDTAQKPIPSRRYLMAHYMPWFEAPPASQIWGWHWTMNHYHPDQEVEGRRQVASHAYPLIGPYDSNDPDVLECQVLLMKLAGIDGVILDWYGTDDFLDYAQNHRNTQHLIEVLKKAGLKYAVLFEEDTVPRLIAAKRLPETEVVTHGQQLLTWMQAHWFTDPAYLTLGGRPVFLTFGNGYYREEQWKQIFAGLPQPPQFFTETEPRAGSVGGFAWPQPHGGTEASLRELDHFYSLTKPESPFIPAAFSRFDDIYEQAGVQKSWGHIDDREGKTYAETLDRALKSAAAVIQLVTWNDWGEGTEIEPSVEYGYRDLETTQRLRRLSLEPAFAYKATDLRLPVALFQLRKHYTQDAAVTAKLEEASRALFAGQIDRARKLLSAFPADQKEPGVSR